MKILAIETSCDETAAAVKDETGLLSSVVFSQIAAHQVYGGVYPELASRLHTEAITTVIDASLKQASITIDDIDVVAVTNCPGLVGSLHVGLQAAKAIAVAKDIPLLGCSHIFGHICSTFIEHQVTLPALSLVVSGGHTDLAIVDKDHQITRIGCSVDDAVGEAFDKVARLLDLPYPGGPNIDKLARKGQPVYQLPFPKNDETFDFSFSGLKTHVLSLVKKIGILDEGQKADIAASFSYQAIHILISKTKRALEQYQLKTLLVSGGVAANSYLREALLQFPSDIKVVIPSMKYCGDNAAMIAYAAQIKLDRGQNDSLDLAVKSNVGERYE